MRTGEKEHSTHVSVPSGEGIRVDKTITIERPTGVVFAYWTELENLPRFMQHLESVKVTDDLHSHWKAAGPAGTTLEWDAEIIEKREGEMISWRSLPGSEIENAGSVWFRAVPESYATEVRVEMKYNPPGGKAGDLIAALFGEDAESAMEEDLARLKTLLETGELPEEERGPFEKATEAIQKAAKATDRCVNENPWSALLISAGVCLIGGVVLGSRLAVGERSTRLRKLGTAIANRLGRH